LHSPATYASPPPTPCSRCPNVLKDRRLWIYNDEELIDKLANRQAEGAESFLKCVLDNDRFETRM
jgi:hypothetical protein